MNQELRVLMTTRDHLEQEAELITNDLNNPGPNGEKAAGVQGALIDDDGFPRSDIDLYRIRTQRSRLAIINTDYHVIMNKIEKGLHAALYQDDVNDSQSSNVQQNQEQQPVSSIQQEVVNSSSTTTTSVFSLALPIIARIDEVSESSPASEAGIDLNDFLISFGRVNAQTPTSDIPRAINEELMDCVNNNRGSIPIVVRRSSSGEIASFQITPREWSGRGYLGCHLNFNLSSDINPQ